MKTVLCVPVETGDGPEFAAIRPVMGIYYPPEGTLIVSRLKSDPSKGIPSVVQLNLVDIDRDERRLLCMTDNLERPSAQAQAEYSDAGFTIYTDPKLVPGQVNLLMRVKAVS